MTTKKPGIRKLITRILLYRELSGYDVYKEVLSKGVQVKTNYLYMILTEMRSKGLLAARWVETGRGPRKHLYSLSEAGREEFRQMVKDSLTLMMDAYVHANLNARDGPDHADAIRSSFELVGARCPGKGDRLVIASPSFDPLVCTPLGFRIMSEMFPGSSIVVVRPPGLRFYEDRPNITFVDGQRHDMPLKDGFADYLMLEGFPREASEKATILECKRVLKDRGHLMLRFPIVMTEEKRPKFANFAEFAMKQYYDTFEQDRKVSRDHLRSLVSEHFDAQREAEIRGNVVIHAVGKRNTTTPSGLISPRQGGVRAPLSIRKTYP